MNFEDPQFTASYEQSVALYARYQMAIHGDSPSDCCESEVLHDYYTAPGSHLPHMLAPLAFLAAHVTKNGSVSF